MQEYNKFSISKCHIWTQNQCSLRWLFMQNGVFFLPLVPVRETYF